MNKRHLIYLIPLLFIISAAIAYADYYELELKYDYINDKVILSHIYVIGGEAPSIVERGDYKFELRSFSNEVLNSFSFFMSANNNRVLVKSPYYNYGKTINIYDENNNKLLEIDVGYFADVCGDNECQDHENTLDCPEDCPSGGRDGFCDKISEGKCDPDCLAGDYDCEARKLKVFFVSIGIALFIVILILIFLRMGPIKVQRKHYENILELKNYIITNLRRGHPKKQIFSELLKDGWPKKLIKKAFKTIKPEHTTKEQLLELHNYIINAEKQGYTDEQIKKELLKDGWSEEAVQLSFKTIEKPKTVPKQEILELENYIMNTLSKGYTKEQITYVLSKEGWPTKTIDRIFDKLKYSAFAKKK